MSILKHISIFLLIITLTVSSVLPVQAAQPREDSLRQLGGEIGEGLLDEVVFDNLERLAGPACNMYGLGIDLVNFVYDGQWPLYASLLEMSVLFRNQSWRELIWAMNDQRDALLEQLTTLNKRKCVVRFGLPEAWHQGDEETRLRGQELLRLDRQILELQEKINYFKLQQQNLLWDNPKFDDTLKFTRENFTFPVLNTELVFYWLYEAPFLSWDQVMSDAKQFGLRTYEDLAVVLENIPEVCFAATNIAHELGLYFIYAFSREDAVYTDEEGNTYETFREFVRANASEITREYIDTYCAIPDNRNIPDRDQTSVEKQYEDLRASLENLLDTVSQSLSGLQAEITLLEQERLERGLLQSDKATRLVELQKENGKRQAMIEYYSIVLSKVGSPASQSLTNLSKKLSEFVEAVVGVTRDEEGRLESRLSFSERFENSKARQLQNICGRIEAMYRKAGRSTADLPIVGSAEGKVYCRASLDCADVDLSNFVGGSEGRRKLAECSGFLFNSSELGYSQQTQDEINEMGEDVGFLLEQRSYNDLLKLKTLHFVSLREKYGATYGTADTSTAQLDKLLLDVKENLCGETIAPSAGSTGVKPILCGTQIFNPNQESSKNHLSVLRRIYESLWLFMSKQEGSCPAPKTPEV